MQAAKRRWYAECYTRYIRMLSILRRFAAPVALVAMAVLAAPTVAFECRVFAAEDGMPCCKRTQPAPASFDGDCCTIAPATPGPTQTPSAPGAAAQIPAPGSTVAVFAATIPSAPRVPGTFVSSASPPLDRLSLNLSAVRR